MLRTDYKDEVLPVGQPYRKYNIIGEDGRVVQANVHLEKSYVPEQEGDKYGAGEINELNDTVNNMVSSIQTNNFLINGDFLIWQRGEKLTATANKYSGPDMWLFDKACQIEKNPSGMKITNGLGITMYQLITDKRLQGKKVVLTKSVNGKVTHEKKTIDFGGRKTYRVSISGLNTNDIVNYVMLTLGDTPHEHQPEDQSLALLSCQRYFRDYGSMYDAASLIQTYTTLTSTNGRFWYPVQMMGNPTITIKSAEATEIGGESLTSTVKASVVNSKAPYVEFKLTHKKTRTVSVKYLYVFFTASCEPMEG